MKTVAELFDLTGKGAIVTGGAMGIGKGIALRLSEVGAGVIIADINMEIANQTAEEIKASGGKAQAIHADARNVADAQKVAQATVEAFGSLDILINNVGARNFSLTPDINEETWDNVIDVNLKAMFFYCQAAAKEMVKAGHGGKIVNISSAGALRPHGFCAHYDASKGGVISLTTTLALEFAPHNIQVNAIAPGGTMTPGVIEDAKGLQRLREEHGAPIVNAWSVNLPWHRLAEPDDIAKVALFLVSEAADYMTGVLLPVDGGRLLI